MNTTILSTSAWALVLVLTAPVAYAASPAVAADPPASGPAASHPRERPAPSTSPAVRASRETQTPGDLRPENPVVPQIAVPLRKPGNVPANRRAASASTGEIDDNAARCRAATSQRERDACTRGGTVPAPPKR